MFETYLRLLEKLGGLSPIDFDGEHLVAVAKELPLPVGIALVGAGLVACLLGGRRFIFRLVLAPIAVAAAFALAPKAAVLLHLAPKTASWIVAGLAGTTAVVFPPAILFAGFGVAGALAGGELAGSQDYWVGFIPGFVIGGALALIMHRIIAVVVSSLIGAAMFVVGLLCLISFTRLASLILGAPILSLGLAGCVAVAAMAFQFKFGPADDEEREKARLEKLKEKEIRADDKARDKRFKEYGKKKAAQ
jgi:hypothetical protein